MRVAHFWNQSTDHYCKKQLLCQPRINQILVATYQKSSVEIEESWTIIPGNFLWKVLPVGKQKKQKHSCKKNLRLFLRKEKLFQLKNIRIPASLLRKTPFTQNRDRRNSDSNCPDCMWVTSQGGPSSSGLKPLHTLWMCRLSVNFSSDHSGDLWYAPQSTGYQLRDSDQSAWCKSLQGRPSSGNKMWVGRLCVPIPCQQSIFSTKSPLKCSSTIILLCNLYIKKV